MSLDPNKFLNIQPPGGFSQWPVISVIYAAMGRITGYQPPAEEKEHVLTEFFSPDLKISCKKPK